MQSSHLLCLSTITGLILAGSTASSLAQAAQPPVWEKSAALGLTLTRGNSDTLLFTGSLQATRKAKEDEWLLGVEGTYGENNSVKNNESLHGYGQYNRFITERLYGYLRVDGLHDEIADLKYRVTVSPGLGYYFIKNDSTRLSAEVGPGLVYEKQGAQERGYLTLRVAERFEHKFNEKTKLWQTLEFLPQVDRVENYIVNGEIGIDTALTQKLSLRSYLQDTYDHQPAPGRQKNDLKLVTALAYKF